MRRYLLFLFLMVIFFSCKSVEYVKIVPPEYELEEIERPILKRDDSYGNEDVTELIRYALKLELQLNTFKSFYDNLRKQ